jgi:hypothetical protein
MRRKWLVTVCDDGDAFTHGPACVVEAESAVEAANVGVQTLADEERGSSSAYGIECEHCDRIAIEHVTVFDMSTGESFVPQTLWGARG